MLWQVAGKALNASMLASLFFMLAGTFCPCQEKTAAARWPGQSCYL